MSRISPTDNRQSRRPCLKILCLLLSMATVYSGAGFYLDRNNYKKGHAAYKTLDCSVAANYFDSVINQWRLIDFGGYASLAYQEKAECFDFKKALAQQKSGNLSQAIFAYKTFVDNHDTNSVLVKNARDRIKSLFENSEATALENPEICNIIIELNQEKLIPKTDPKLPPLYIYCGENYTVNGSNHQAARIYEGFLDQYPNHALVPQVKTVLAKLLVAQAQEEGAKNLPAPQREGSTSDSLSVVRIQNDSPEPMRIIFSGPEGRIEELEKCSSCRTYVGKPPESCPKQGPVGTYTLKPGEYDVVVKAIGNRPVNPFKGDWSLGSGGIYPSCFYLVTNPVQQESKSF
ncbi:MAG: hypothetical protein F6J86_24630 [Symploca sp. SIO1B1]|nr:hypothetical protein [Symploca sp. SIO1C2]NER96997.1 hypothetical protein [Symploca sp. SIO1B1]